MRRRRTVVDDDEDIRFCPNYGEPPGRTPNECDRTCTSWVAHAHPERPLGYCAWVCDCRLCRASIRAAAKAKLDIGLVLKSGMDRQIITLDEAVAAMDEFGDEYGMDTAYLRYPDDYMREIYVVQWPHPLPRRRLLVLPGGGAVIPWRKEYDEDL